MSTSGTATFNLNRLEIVKEALALAKVIDPEDSLDPNVAATANRHLNIMLKAWQGNGKHLWLRTEGALFLQKGQVKYELYSSGAHATQSYVQALLSADAASSATTINVVSTSGMTAGDNIGIELDTGYLHWTTIATIPDATTLTLATGISSAAASSNYVYAYTAKIGKPIFIETVRRFFGSNQEVPLVELSYLEYMNQPSKTQQSTPNSYAFSPQRDKGDFYVWQAPNSVRDVIKFTYGRQIEDMNAALNNPDLPQEFLEPIIYKLAARLANVFGMAHGEDYQNLLQMASVVLDDMTTVDTDYAPVFFQFSGRR